MIVYHLITSLDDGGAEGAMYRLIKFSAMDDVSHHVICLRDHGKYGSLLEEIGVSVHTLDLPKGRVNLKGMYKLHFLLKKGLETGTPIILQTWMYHSDLLGSLLCIFRKNIAVVWGIRNNKIHSSSKLTHIIARLSAFLSRFSPVLIVCCSSEAAVNHKKIGYDSGKFRLIANGYDFGEFFQSDDLRRNLRRDLKLESTVVLGCVARWDPQKDHENLFHAISLWMKRASIDFELVLVGYGCEPGNLKLVALLKSFDLFDRTKLLGAREDVPALMNSFDLHLLASKSEAFPNVIAEAMLCGTPCISTDVGDATEIIADTGWVVPAENSVVLADCIGKAVQEIGSDLFEKRKLNCIERIEYNYSVKKMVDNFHSVWRDALATI